MQARLNYGKVAPGVYDAMDALDQYLGKCGLDESLLHLLRLRASQERRFLQGLAGPRPSASFPTYVAFAFYGGFTLGLWSTQTVNPAPSVIGNRTELAFVVEGAPAVEDLHADWSKRGMVIAQKPMTAVFGRTFVALDPDGHRLRVCCPDK